MQKTKIYLILVLSISLVVSTSGFAELCNCIHETKVGDIEITNTACFSSEIVPPTNIDSCCSEDVIIYTNKENSSNCKDLHNSCTVCNSETFISSNNRNAILVNDTSSFFHSILKKVKIILNNDYVGDSKGITFLKFLRMNNLSNKLGKDILISIHKLKIHLPALA